MEKRFILLLCTLLVGGDSHGVGEGYFWHLTDFHYDPWYQQFGTGACTMYQQTYGKFGDFDCDSPYHLVMSSIQQMKMLDGEKSPEFIAVTGDNTPHTTNLNNELILNIAQNITNILKTTYPDTLVLPVLGNHDIWPKPQFPAGPDAMYDAYAEMWKTWLTDGAGDTFKQGGYYTVPLPDGHTHAVVLNNVLYYTSNSLTENMQDPANQFQWLEDTLGNMRQQGKKVFLFYHVPIGKVHLNDQGRIFGKHWIRPDHNTRMVDITTEYSDVIIGSFCAHTHLDNFKIFYNEQGTPVNVLYIAPSVTPWRRRFSASNPEVNGPAHNPALRKIHYSKSDFSITQIEQYSLNLEEANRMEAPSWQLTYTFTDLYGVDSMHPYSLHDLIEDMEYDGSREFESYIRMNTVDTDHPTVKSCNCLCKTAHLCGMTNVRYDDFDACFVRQEYCPTISAAGAVFGATWLQLVSILTYVAIARL